ncbi:MAG TPA: alanine--tRNA ligase-related protein, partial [Vitreimonas sp.]|nr:alanine--tRNA ligase-related protein [Vitreimonas sp.]
TVQLEEALIPLTSSDRVVGRRPEELPPEAPVLPGEIAFRLHDTYGFPIDLTVELAAEYGVLVDRPGFEEALAEQRQRSRSGKKAELVRHAERSSQLQAIQQRVGDTTFLGYETTTATATVVSILRGGVEYDELAAKGDAEGRTEAGAEAEVILDRTPFYAEGGGQIGDRGELRTADGEAVLFDVDDTQKPVGGVHVHHGILRGRLRVGDTVNAVVDGERRAHTMRNHTGTHVLHRALRNVVGDRARQAGSLVTPESLRFDFPFERGLTDDEKRQIELEVRRVVRDDLPVQVEFMPMATAIDRGADAFFDEKYGETVRTIRVGDYSLELCGGTHCRASGQIGSFVITGERSIGSGMRRIEALTGAGADAFVAGRLDVLERAATAAGALSADALPDRIAALQEELRETRRRLRAGGGTALPKPGELAQQVEEPAPGVRLVAASAPWESVDVMKGVARDVRGVLGSGVVALALEAEEPQVFVTVSDDLVGRGIAAGDLVRAAVGPIEGRGGGRPEMAQGKGSRPDGLPDALEAVRAALRDGNRAEG